jgi:hypothetical protein
MVEDMFNKIYSIPGEVYTNACIIISDKLIQYGFKYLKSRSEIKKTDKKLVYLISFYSSNYNYINQEEGHVVLGMGCFIKNRGNGHNLYTVMQRTLMGIYEYELYKNGKIDKQSIDTANNFIENRFLPVMFEIENNINNLLEKICKSPAGTFDDYRYRYEKEIFEIFGRNDLLNEYEEKMDEYERNKIKRQENDYQKYLASKQMKK